MSIDRIEELWLGYLDGQLTADERGELLDALRNHPEILEELLEDRAINAALGELGRDQADVVQLQCEIEAVLHAESDSSKFMDRMKRRLKEEATADYPIVREPARFWNPHRMAAAAAILLITMGLLALWMVPGPLDRPLTQHERRRQRIFIEQLEELSLEREAIEIARIECRPRPKPGIPPPYKERQAAAERDTEEAARFIEARRRFVMQQLRMFHGRGPLPDDLDVEDYDPDFPVTTTETANAGGPVKVGSVLLSGTGSSGVLIRENAEGAQQLELRKGLTLMTSDRIETSRDAGTPCTSFQLDGGATIDLDRATTVELLGRDNLRFHRGRLYAHIAVPYPEDTYPESEPPFSLQTEGGRFLTHQLQAELHLSPNEVFEKDLCARIDSGKTHLINHKGHVVGRKGQELRARKNARPSREEGFTGSVWRGRDRRYPNLPFGRSNPVVFSTATLTKYYGTHYAIALAFRGEIRLIGLQASQGDPKQEFFFRSFQLEAPMLQRYDRCFPLPVLGTLSPLSVPASRQFKNTQPLKSHAADQILNLAKQASGSKPLVFVCHGSATDLACAWLTDSSIAGKIIVVAALPPQNSRWWQRDPWSAEIVLRHFRCVLLPNKYMTVDPDRMKRITDSRWASMVRKERLGDWNSRLLCFLADPDPRARISRLRFAGVHDDNPTFESAPRGRIWRLSSAPTREEVLNEFDRVFLAPVPVQSNRRKQ